MALSADYAVVLEHLRDLGPELATAAAGLAARKFDLMHMRVLLGSLGNPQEQFRSVLIAGTNGKGSTAATLASILNAAGLQTGLYTSPHLLRVNERMQRSVAMEPTEYSAAEAPGTRGHQELESITDEAFARLYVAVDDAGEALVAQKLLPHTPSFFERMTAVAFLWFAETGVAWAVLEVGLGGRLDATNVVQPVLSILTDVALDHQEYLGNTLAAITREKAGILRPQGTLITLPQHPEVNQTLGEIAAGMPEMQAISAAAAMPVMLRGGSGERWHGTELLPVEEYTVQVGGRPIQVASPLRGAHQKRNVALALTAAETLREQHGVAITDAAMVEGVRQTRWPGRLEQMEIAGRAVLLDVAHNPAGAWTLRSVLAEVDAARPRTLLFSCLRDKDLGEMAQILFPLFDGSSTDPERRGDHLVLAAVASQRAASAAALEAEARRLDIPAHVAPHVIGALRQALDVTPADGFLVVTGSVYLIGEVKQALADGLV